MIARIWHGFTTYDNAIAYESLLKSEIFPSIERKKVKGYHKISLLRRNLDNEVEFITIMLFENMQSVKAFAGEDYHTAYVPAKARAILSRFDDTSQHYQIIDEYDYSA